MAFKNSVAASAVKTSALGRGVSAQTALLQRKCACGGSGGLAGECGECGKKKLQRKVAGNQAANLSAPPIVYEALMSSGQELDAGTRAFMESRFGHDFSRVRVHTDQRAAESAEAVNALAYTVGRDIVFGAGLYSPGSYAGRGLLAHELGHVLQQANSVGLSNQPLTVQPGESLLEDEAERVARRVMSHDRVAISQSPGGPLLMKKAPGGSAPPAAQPAAPPAPPPWCDQATIEAARPKAFDWCDKAYRRITGIGIEEPLVERWKQHARTLASRVFTDNPSLEKLGDVVKEMRRHLRGRIATVCADVNEPFCSDHEAYVDKFQPPIHFCKKFFERPARQVETLVHEAAHLAGIGRASNEPYCLVFDCKGACGDSGTADSWAHFVHCLSGQSPQQPETPEGGGRP